MIVATIDVKVRCVTTSPSIRLRCEIAFAAAADGRAVHPLWSAIACSTLIAAGVGALAFNFPIIALAVIVFAAGAGVSYIVRGTLPLALFGPVGYATLMGKLALPSLVAQALAPWAATFAFTRTGIDAFLVGLFGLALANLVILAVAATLTKAEHPSS